VLPAPSSLVLTQADSARAIASMYSVSLLATLPLVLVALGAIVIRRASAEARALLWRSAIVVLLVMFVGRQLPLHWMAWVVPSLLASPLIALGRLQVTADAPHVPGAADSYVPEVVLVLFVVYVAGVCMVLAPTVIAAIRHRRMRSSAARSSNDWASDVHDVCAHLGIRRAVRVFISTSASVPMTWGIWNPVVMLPAMAEHWSTEQRRMVLTHELAHVRAADWAFNLLARVTCALFWFHPGVWWIARSLREDCEIACDDRVIASGVRRSDYAELLVSAADMLPASHRTRAAALTLSNRRGLRARLATVLDTRHDVRPLARGWAVIAALGTVTVAAPMSVVHLSPTRSVLTSLMLDAHWESRAYAVVRLAQRADSVAVARSAAELDPNPSVRALARYALSQRARGEATPADPRAILYTR
jgi:beta-lactamase regulating signal transducer with metallopeptidase domain